jgi:hypothetical protein
MTSIRTTRLEKIIGRLNRAFSRRRALGLPTGHLIARTQPLSAAYLAARHADLCTDA